MDMFCKTILSENDLSRRGWNLLPKIDAAGILDWKLLCEKIRTEELIDNANTHAEWVSTPMEVKNQQLFSLDTVFTSKLSSVQSTSALRKIWNCKGNGEPKINLTPIVCRDEAFIDSKAWAFSVHHLSKYRMPKSLQFRTVDAIFSRGQWFTEAHVELCGDESISATLLGKKLFLYTLRGEPSKLLVQQMKSSKSFRDFIFKGPPPKLSDKWFASIPEPTSCHTAGLSCPCSVNIGSSCSRCRLGGR